jgi:hypothetical protein
VISRPATQEIFEEYRARLVPEWRQLKLVFTPLDDADDDDDRASISYQSHYSRGYLYVSPAAREDEAGLRQSICHEMVHLILRDYERISTALVDANTDSAREVLRRERFIAEERVVDRIAELLV